MSEFRNFMVCFGNILLGTAWGAAAFLCVAWAATPVDVSDVSRIIAAALAAVLFAAGLALVWVKAT